MDHATLLAFSMFSVPVQLWRNRDTPKALAKCQGLSFGCSLDPQTFGFTKVVLCVFKWWEWEVLWLVQSASSRFWKFWIVCSFGGSSWFEACYDWFLHLLMVCNLQLDPTCQFFDAEATFQKRTLFSNSLICRLRHSDHHFPVPNLSPSSLLSSEAHGDGRRLIFVF